MHITLKFHLEEKKHNLGTFELSEELLLFLDKIFSCETCVKRKIRYFLKVKPKPKDQAASFIVYNVKELLSKLGDNPFIQPVTWKDMAMINVLHNIHTEQWFLCDVGNGIQRMYQMSQMSLEFADNFILQIEENFQLKENWQGWQIHSNLNSVRFWGKQLTVRDDLLVTVGLRLIIQTHLQNSVKTLQTLCVQNLVLIIAEKLKKGKIKNELMVENILGNVVPKKLKQEISQLCNRFICMREILKRKEILDIGDLNWQFGSEDRLTISSSLVLRTDG